MVASCANWIPEILGRSVRSGYRSSPVCTYPAPITTIFSGRATKALGTRSIAGDVKKNVAEEEKKKKKNSRAEKNWGDRSYMITCLVLSRLLQNDTCSLKKGTTESVWLRLSLFARIGLHSLHHAFRMFPTPPWDTTRQREDEEKASKVSLHAVRSQYNIVGKHSQ